MISVQFSKRLSSCIREMSDNQMNVTDGTSHLAEPFLHHLSSSRWGSTQGMRQMFQVLNRLNSVTVLTSLQLFQCLGDLLGNLPRAKVFLDGEELKPYTLAKRSNPLGPRSTCSSILGSGEGKDLKPWIVTGPLRKQWKKMDRPFIQSRRPGSRTLCDHPDSDQGGAIRKGTRCG
jgi:hypothetical protein